MTTIKLGQLFLLRRDLKAEVNASFNEITVNVAHRADAEESNTLDYTEAYSEWEYNRKLLIAYDQVIEEANSKPGRFEFQGFNLSLNHARHLKVHIQAEISSLNSLLSLVARQPKVFRETVYEQVRDTFPGSSTATIPKVVEIKNIINVDTKVIKSKVSTLVTDLQLLDSLMQQADWSIEVELPVVTR